MSRNSSYISGNLLDYKYFSKHYRLIAIDLSKQIELEDPDLKQQINFIGKLEEDNGETMFFITGKLEETTFEFSQNSVSIKKTETQKIIIFLNDLSNEESKFATKMWYIIVTQTAKGKYNQNKSNKFETESIKSSLYYSDDYFKAFILVTGDITVTTNNNTYVAFKNAPFSTCKIEINDVFIDAENHIFL